MSSALALAGVTAALRDLLNDGLINHSVAGVLGSTVTVSAMPLDRVVPNGGSESSQLNLFLYKVTPNQGWRNEGLPARDGSGRARLANPPLALDLHYLLSAFSSAELHGEILLGYGMQLLHENPVLTREALRTALIPAPDVGAELPAALRALDTTGLDEQVEQLRITPSTLNSEDLSRLWGSSQVNYRPTSAYRVSVVLIEASRPARVAPPVLTRGPVDPGTGLERGVAVQPDLVPALPTLEAVVPPDEQPVARLEQDLELRGHHLDGTGRGVRLRNARFGVDERLVAEPEAQPANASGRIVFRIPAARAADFPVGIYDVTGEVQRPGESHVRETNRLAMVLAPDLLGLPMDVVPDGGGTAEFQIAFRPDYRPGQSVTVMFGSRELEPLDTSGPRASFDLRVPDAPSGGHLIRLRLDGIESPVVDRRTTPPSFLDLRVNIL